MCVFHYLGGDVDEAYEPAIGRKRQDACASIFVDNKKVTAVSSIRPSRRDCEVQFRIVDASSAFPTISVLDDVSSWQIGKIKHYAFVQQMYMSFLCTSKSV